MQSKCRSPAALWAEGLEKQGCQPEKPKQTEVCLDALFCCNPTAYQLIPRSYVTQGAHYTNLLANFPPGRTDQSKLYTEKTQDNRLYNFGPSESVRCHET